MARREDRLKALANTLLDEKGKFHPFQTDVTKEDEILRAFEWVKQNFGAFHILINNVGVFKHFPLSDFKSEDARALFDVNVLSLAIANREALKTFKEKDIIGHIININSILGHIIYDVPNIGMHAASKHAVTALTEALYLEINRLKLGIKVTVSQNDKIIITTVRYFFLYCFEILVPNSFI